MLTFGSLFAGIGGFDAGFEAAGLRCLWQVEIESDCRSVLARHFPESERFEDVRAVGRHNLKPVDVICGGFPCQDLSVAGKRAGLEGERSGLFYQMVRVTHELRPSFLVWENVPGLLSSDDGRDFARVLISLDAIGYSGAWTGLDAQWFGVAQRRRRLFGVFARADIGAARCAEILSLRESVRRDTPTRGEARERVAATVTRGIDTNRDGWAPVNEADNLIAEPFTFDWQAGSSGDTSFRGKARSWIEDKPGRTRSLTANRTLAVACNNFGEREVSTALSTSNERIDGDTETFVVTPFDTTQITSDKNYSSPQPEDPCHPLASGAHAPAIAFNWQGGGTQTTLGADTEKTCALQVGQTPAVALTEGAHGVTETPVSSSLQSNGGKPGQGYPAALTATGVRRLTPRECERLQGFPDDWTATGASGEAISDSARYRMLGNAVAEPCAKWIGERIVKHAARSTGD